jgi:hypothetical protein
MMDGFLFVMITKEGRRALVHYLSAISYQPPAFAKGIGGQVSFPQLSFLPTS